MKHQLQDLYSSATAGNHQAVDPEDGRHPLPEGPGGVDAQEAGCSGRERRQHHQVLGSGPVHQSALFRAPKLSKKRYLPKNTVKVSISTTGTVLPDLTR